jgi:hypothetical protein
MGDEERIEGIEPGREEETELVIMGPEEAEAAAKAEASRGQPAGVTLTAAEYEALKREGAQAGAIQAGLEGLASRMQPVVVNQPAAVAVQETEEERDAKIEEELFARGKGPRAIRTLAREEARKMVAPALAELLRDSQEQFDVLLEAHPEKGPQLKKYDAEVKEELAKLTPAQRMLPTSKIKALDRVLQRHGPELEADRISRAVDARLKEMGIEVKDGKPVVAGANGKPPAVGATEAGGQSGASVSSGGGGKKKVVTVTREERARWSAEAERRQIDPDEYMQTKLRGLGRL